MAINSRHIAEAHQLTETERERRGTPIVAAMRRQGAPDYMERDKMGIAVRPSTVLGEAIEPLHATGLDLACARHLLWYGGASTNAITAVEFAQPSEDRPARFQDTSGRPIPYLCIAAEDHGVYTLPGF